MVWLLFLLIGSAALWWALVGPGARESGDFVQEYVLARATADHVDAYAPIADLAHRYVSSSAADEWSASPHPTPHPPTAGVMLLPLALLDYWTAFRVWVGVQLVALACAVWATGRLLGHPPKIRWTVALTSILLVWQPVLQNIQLGQLMLVLLALTVSGWVSLSSGRAFLGGVLIGLALLLKPVTWPVLVLLALRGNVLALAGGIVVCSGALAVTILLTSTRSVVFYVLDVLPQVTNYYATDLGNISLWTIAFRVLGAGITQEVPVWLATPNFTGIPSALVPVVILSLFIWRTRRTPSGFPTVLALSALTSPLSWTFYLVLAVPAVAVLGRNFSETAWSGHFPYKLATLGTSALLLVPWGAWKDLGNDFSIAPALVLLMVLVLLNAPYLVQRPDRVRPHNQLGSRG